MNISVVISLFNEEESLPELSAWIKKVMEDNKFSYEILMIDDGSNDSSWSVIQDIRTKDKNVKGIKFRRNYGKSAALYVGFKKAIGDVIITMDADLQDSPEEIPGLYKMVTEEDFDLVSGWKKKRYDPILSKNLPSKIFNGTARLVSGIKLNDFNCGLKAYKSKVVKSIEVYGEMHRYIPILAKQAGFMKIGQRVVAHQERKYGVSKFGIERFVNGFLDLLTITFMSKFAKRPMHFFGALGSLCFFTGFSILIYLSIAKVAWNQYQMTDRPLFYLGAISLVFGTQLFLTGFLAEIITRTSSQRNDYTIETELP